MLVTLRGQRVKQGKAHRKKSQTFHAKVTNIFWLKDVNVNAGKNITPLTTSFLSCFSSSMSSSSNKATRSPKKIVHHQDCMMRKKKDCYIELLSTKFISDQDRCFAALFIQSSHSLLYCYSLLYSSLLIHQAGAYPSSHVA